MCKRILATMMAVFVFVGAVGYRPQKTYAAELVAAEGLEVLFGLLGAAGVVVGFEESMEQRMQEAQEMFDSLPAAQQQSYIDWLAAGEFVTSDTGHTVFYPDMTLDTSWYSDLWQSVTGFFDSTTTYDFVDAIDTYDGYIRYLPTSSADNLDMYLGGYADNAYAFHGGGIDNGRVFYFLNDTTFVQHFYNEYSGESTFTLYECSADSVLRVRTSYLSTGIYLYLDVCSPTHTYFSYNNTIKYANTYPEREQGAIWGSDSASDSVYAYPQLYRLNFNPLEAYNYDALIPCDTWVSKWDDAKTENRQVGIITGQDLSGYNTLEDIYNPETGLVTGLDSPVVTPDIPDVPTDTDILSKLNALPALIATAVVGEGELDFSAFNDIKLSGIFPFCIPFDLINSFKAFNVPAIAPIWTIEFSKTPLVGATDMEIDLTEFEVLFAIGRYFSYAFFVLGLILVTRRIIRG